MKKKKYTILTVILFFALIVTIIGTAGNLSAYDLLTSGTEFSDELFGVNSSDASATQLFNLPEGC